MTTLATRIVARSGSEIRKVKHLLQNLTDPLLPDIRQMDYCGYKLTYSRGFSLVQRLRRYGTYEDTICRNLIKTLDETNAKTFVDIGANIGLISLRVLSERPSLKIYAFEPGPHQHDLFRQTIAGNRLGGQIVLSDVALSDRSGTAEFAVHPNHDSAGDGLLDTGRAGPASRISVTTSTLDDWWTAAKKPGIDVMKIDTEGAELLVLRGAQQTLAATRPILFLEMWPENFRNYPYTIDDVYAGLVGLGYAVRTHAGRTITPSDCADVFGHESDFIAYPLEKSAPRA